MIDDQPEEAYQYDDSQDDDDLDEKEWDAQREKLLDKVYSNKKLENIPELQNVAFVQFVQSLIQRNRNLVGICYGKPGTGKSYSMLALAEMLSPITAGRPFDHNNLCFTAQEFVDKIANENMDKLKSGDVIVWDEIGTQIDNRNFWSIVNKSINYIVQTFRFKNLILLMTVPASDMIDKNIRKLTGCHFETQKIDKTHNLCIIKPLVVEFAPAHTASKTRDGTYSKYIRATFKGQKFCVSRLFIPLPSVKLRHEYERRKMVYANNLYQGIKANLISIEPRTTSVLTPKQQRVYDMRRRYPSATQLQIANDLGIAPSDMSDVMNSIRRKGYKVDRVLTPVLEVTSN